MAYYMHYMHRKNVCRFEHFAAFSQCTPTNGRVRESAGKGAGLVWKRCIDAGARSKTNSFGQNV